MDGDAAVSDLAQHAVYVLHRSIIQVKPRGGKAESSVRKFLIEVVYQQVRVSCAVRCAAQCAVRCAVLC